MAKYIPARKVREHYDVTTQTLQNWAKSGKIPYRTIKHAKRTTWLYDLQGVGRVYEEGSPEPEKKLIRILYTRVSSSKQRDDLRRQIELLQKEYPEGEVISDIGSGLNFKRPGLCSLVKKVCNGDVGEIVVTYKDRLLRFGFDLFKQVCKEHGVKLVVWSQKGSHQEGSIVTRENELQDDLLSVINIFVARRNGLRSGELKKARAKQLNENQDLSDEDSTM